MIWVTSYGGRISFVEFFKVLKFGKTPLGGYNLSWGPGEYVYCRGNLVNLRMVCNDFEGSGSA